MSTEQTTVSKRTVDAPLPALTPAAEHVSVEAFRSWLPRVLRNVNMANGGR